MHGAPAPLPVDDVFYTLDFDADMLDAVRAEERAGGRVKAEAVPGDDAGGSAHGGVEGPSIGVGGAMASEPAFEMVGASPGGVDDVGDRGGDGGADDKGSSESPGKSLSGQGGASPLVLVDEGTLRGEPLRAALDRVLGALTSMGTVALAFQAPVRVEDAPSYYQVIKAPMDLGTMGRKLGEGCYATRRAFHADLLLLLRNCQRFNDPKSLVLKYATQLATKGSKLLHALEASPELQQAVERARTAAEASQAHAALKARQRARVHSDAAGCDRLAGLWAARTAEARRAFVRERDAQLAMPFRERIAAERTPRAMGAAMVAASAVVDALGRGVSPRNAMPVSLEHAAMRDVANWVPNGAWPVPAPAAKGGYHRGRRSVIF